MRHSKSGWKRRDLDNLYKGYDFVISHGSKHDIVKHPIYPQLRTTLPRHSYLARGYVEYAVKLIEELLILDRKESQSGSEKSS